MSQHRSAVSFRHMLDHALEAVAMTKGKTRADLDKDRQLNLAVVRLLEIIGEAASRIPKEDQARHANISWPEIISLRNRLIHGYDTVVPNAMILKRRYGSQNLANLASA